MIQRYRREVAGVTEVPEVAWLSPGMLGRCRGRKRSDHATAGYPGSTRSVARIVPRARTGRTRQARPTGRAWPGRSDQGDRGLAPARTVSAMQILVSADMEGATGVTWGADVLPGTDQWQRFRRLLTADVNACVAGLFDGGARGVLVNEAHGSQRNLLLED